MHSPMYMYETEIRDRVDSYHWWTERRHIQKQIQGSKTGSWLDAIQGSLRAAVSRPVAEVRSWMAKPPEPQEQCC